MAIISGCDASPVFQLAEHALDDIAAPIGVCTENLNPDVVVMKSAKDRV